MRKNLYIIVFNTPTDEIRGKTRRYLYEIKPNVFTGTVSYRVREELWKQIENDDVSASMIFSDKNEQGFSYKTTDNNNRYDFISLDGVIMPYHKKEDISISDLYAKPDKKLIDHLYEAGSVAENLLTIGRGKKAIESISAYMKVDKDELISFICFLCAVHDIGKAHPGFQKTMADNNDTMSDSIRNLMDKELISEYDENIRHERYSREIVERYLIERGFDKYFSENISAILPYHHQGKEKDRKVSEKVFCYGSLDKRWDKWQDIQNKIIEKIVGKWSISKDLEDIDKRNGIEGLSYFILSVMVTSDWIISGSLWKEYLDKYDSIDISAKNFIKDNFLEYNPIEKVFKNISWEDVFDFPKNVLQSKISEMDLRDVSLILLEYPCGFGKTEAALLSALFAGKYCGGLYLAAPTTSTAKGLSKRCSELAIKAGLDIKIPEFDSSMVWSSDDMLKIDKELWTSRNRHQFLYPFAVGTVDQLLKSILSFRYSCIGTLGLSDKAIIVDEVHAYDAYMLTELITLIKWCRFFNIPVILLSATLPTKTKEKLFEAAGVRDAKIDKAYPLISVVKNKELIQVHTPILEKSFAVNVVKTKDMEETMLEEAVNHKEGCLAIIMPTVDSAFSLYDKVKREVTDCPVIIYQGRDTIKHKSDKVDYLIELLGKYRTKRPKKLIVIATSIIEQSLDVDFDRMVTAIAPIDLIIQRMGRVWRHDDKGTIREYMTVENPFTVVIPERYGSLGRIYNRDLLIETEKALSGIDHINIISDIRELIDTVYKYDDETERHKEILSSYHCISDKPFKNSMITINLTEEAYRKFTPIMPKTRDESYPTVQIAILEKEPDENISYEDMQKIMYENVISIAEYKIKDKEGNYLYPVWENDIKWLKNIVVFIGGEEFTLDSTDRLLSLTEDGVRFYERG